MSCFDTTLKTKLGKDCKSDDQKSDDRDVG